MNAYQSIVCVSCIWWLMPLKSISLVLVSSWFVCEHSLGLPAEGVHWSYNLTHLHRLQKPSWAEIRKSAEITPTPLFNKAIISSHHACGLAVNRWLCNRSTGCSLSTVISNLPCVCYITSYMISTFDVNFTYTCTFLRQHANILTYYMP